ncbi:putative phosphatase, C-terminal domain of histone macro H2A1 like protein [Verrucomicrobia bacterium]|nr:putative phosphatase, C-terminal domain of histone macro H2A1 like protein [Verrucomicrobiota bacterium]
MRLIVVTRDKDTAEQIRWIARDVPELEVHLGAFDTAPRFDCVATAGNSFGLMDAGMDLAVLKFFGPELQKTIQRRILDEFCGEQPVGTAFVVETGRVDHPYVAHAPTMRVPMNISGTDHVYLATWATLLAVRQHNRGFERKIESLVCPAFGAGTGGVSAIEVGFQMKLAYRHFLKPPSIINPSFAQSRHESIYYGGKMGFERPINRVP